MNWRVALPLGAMALLLAARTTANERPSLSKDALDAFAYGAQIRIALHVVDSTGRPVEDAVIDLGLSQRGSGHFKELSGKTDVNGDWAVEARCSSLANVRLQKNGYYETRLQKHLFSLDHTDVNNRVRRGKWDPWEQTVVLKEKRQPTPMFLRDTPYQLELPRGIRAGFDCDAADLVAPYGKGQQADIDFLFESETPAGSRYATTNQLQLLARQSKGGFASFPKDTQSRLRSSYTAPTNGYETAVEYRLKRDQAKPNIVYEDTLPKNTDNQNTQYIAFRIRVETDENGNVIHCRYGKIYSLDYGDLDVTSDVKTGFVRLRYYLNPNDCDPNLEFDGKTNLSDPQWRSPLDDL